MSSPAYTYVYYFVPLDGDTEEHMNVFLIRKPLRSVTVGDIEREFPLPGTYMFRFKQQAKSSSHVWLDVGSKRTRTAPQFNGHIVCKVTRLAVTAAPHTVNEAAATTPAPAAPPAAVTSETPRPAPVAPAPVAAQPARLKHSNTTGPAAAAVSASPSLARAASVPAATNRRMTTGSVPQVASRAPAGSSGSGADLLGLFAVESQASPASTTAAAQPAADAAFAAAATSSVASLSTHGWDMSSTATPAAGATQQTAAGAAASAGGQTGSSRSASRSPVFEGNILTGNHSLDMW